MGLDRAPIEFQTFYFSHVGSDMEFVKNFTPSDFQAKNFTPSISPNFNSFSKKKSRNGDTLGPVKLFCILCQRWHLSVPSVPAAV